ncbi:MAG: toll/interleukin-1 receptor domain-containing protein [Deltaproteobacteria bacterium]|nr:toll/interleukin-1 receptor domain-containing protein [Deltaproteobacteria bacterium]
MIVTSHKEKGRRGLDFFISYNQADKAWAEWIAWVLEEAGYSTIIQAWDFRAGENFVLKMQEAATGTERTIAVLSENYLRAEYTQPEWANAFARDPLGKNRTLVPVRVALCHPTGLLNTIIHIDLVGLDAEQARNILLDGLKPDGKPTSPPAYPGAGQAEAGVTMQPTHVTRQDFPGMPSSALDVWREKLEFLRCQEPIITDPAQKFALKKQIQEAEAKVIELEKRLNPR